MKKIIICLFASLAIIATPLQTFADNIGYLDMETLFQKAKVVQKFEENIKEKRTNYQELFEKNQKKLEQAKEKGKSEEDIKKLILKLEEDLRPKQQELAQLEAGFQQNFILSVQTASKETAKILGLDVVLDKRVILYGGFDLTQSVINKINE